MPAIQTPAYEVGARVQNIRSDSQYYGQIGEVIDTRSRTNDPLYTVRWPNGDAHRYREISLSLAPVPERDLQVSDTGNRTVDEARRSTRRVIKHVVPPNSRQPLVQL